MITPFDTPTLWVVSFNAPIAKALESFLQLFVGQCIHHKFTDNSVLTVRNREELHDTFDRQDLHALFNSLCVVDISTSGAAFPFDLRADGQQPLRPTELAEVRHAPTDLHDF